MDKLTLEHLAPYLPYGLNIITTEGKSITKMLSVDAVRFKGQICVTTALGYFGDMWFKPILRPLSDLTKEIEHSGERFVPIDRINRFRIKSPDTFVHKEWTGICDREINIDLTTYGGGSWEGGMEEDIDTFQFYQLYTLLFKWHFDVFGLIAAGLAVDMNTLGRGKDGNA